MPSSVTPEPLYTPPVGEPPPKPACTPALIHKSAGAVKFTIVLTILSLQTSKAASTPSAQVIAIVALLITKIRHKSAALAVITVPEKSALDAGPNTMFPPVPDPELPS